MYQNKNENIYMFDHEVKSYLKLENLKEFSDRRKEKLTKNEKMQRMKIVYIDTDEGILKTYLRPSQYVGCLEDK
ncbi:MAG: hypothetical protein GY861_00225 [bacterium]|nr:hypothetical protein [bacterium]